MLILTRLNGYNDGFGSQYQRILGIYSICKKYNILYYHNPLEDIWYQGLNALKDNKSSTNIVHKINNKIKIKSDINIDTIDNLIIKKIKLFNENYSKTYFKLSDLLQIKINSEKNNENILLYLDNPFIITDIIPNIYKCCIDLYKPNIQKNKIFTIGVHVRRGELFILDSHRMLDNSYYINLIIKLIDLCNKENIDYVVELYTEITNKKIMVSPKHPGILNRINTEIEIDPLNNKIEEFDVIPNLVKYYNEDILDTFDRMVNCEILITSKSSYSTCASYIKNGISIYSKFWHNMSSKDIECNDINFEQKVNSFLLNFI